MAWFSAIVTYLIIWWTLLFTVLPFALKRDEQGRPDDPKLKQKFLITTGISFVVWAVVYGLVQSDLISFYDMATKMVEEDRLK